MTATPLMLLETGFRIEGWIVVPRAHELVRPGETVRVAPKPMEVLMYLAARAGEAVSREELMEAVWPGVFVSDHALNRCISQLRKLFDDEAHTPRVIETIPKVGYRLISPVERVGDGLAAPFDALDMTVTAAPASASTPAPSPTRIPVGRSRILLGGVAVLLLVVLAAFFVARRPASPPVTTPLTTDTGVEMQAVWSPDGTRLAYIHADEGVRSLWTHMPGVDTPLQLTDGPSDSSPAWAPDGTAIAFVRCDPTPCRLFSMSPLGGDVRQLANGSVPFEGGRWMPDGLSFLLSGSPVLDEDAGLTQVDLDTGVRRALTEPPEGFRDVLPRFSPDGSTVSFLRRGAAGDDLYRVASTGGTPERLTSDYRTIAGHTWSEDGRTILFSSSRTGVYALWQVPSGGGPLEAVTGPAVRDPGGPAVAPTGNRLVVEDWVFEINLWESSEGGEPVRLVSSTLWDKQPHLSADGSRITFISNRTGPPEVWTGHRDGSGLVRITDFGGPSVEHPRFSPDGRSIVFQARPETQADLYVLDATGGVPWRITTHAADDVAPRWSRDGRSVYFGSNRSGEWQVWRIHVEGGEATPMTTVGGYAAEESSDGALIVARYAEAGLWRVIDGDEERFARLPGAGDWGNWATTSRGTIVFDREEGTLRLVRLDAADEPAAPLDFTVGRLMHGEPGFAVSEDGETVIAAHIDRVEADLLLVESFD